jgi:hypothetical protein
MSQAETPCPRGIDYISSHYSPAIIPKRIQGGSSTLRDTRYEQLSEIVKRDCTFPQLQRTFEHPHLRQKPKHYNFAVEAYKVGEREYCSIRRTLWGQLC